VSDVDHDSLTD